MAMSLLRDRRDRLGLYLLLLPPLAVAAVPHPLTVAGMVWWLGNTVGHQAVHRRWFRSRMVEAAFAVGLSLLQGVPQELWRQRHLAHHAGRARPLRANRALVLQAAVLAIAWGVALWLAPRPFLAIYLPGLCGGALLAALQGHYEHRGGTTNINARWWNVLFCNDGYHVEHHANPARHWGELPMHRVAGARTSVLPPVLRWLAAWSPAAMLDRLERLVLRWPWLQRQVLAAHRRALAKVLAGVAAPQRIVVVGGGLFPRSALLLRERFPLAKITVLDSEPSHLAAARAWLPAGTHCVCERFVAGQQLAADLVVLPLALRGARSRVIEAPPAPLLLVHDWAWQRVGRGCVVAWWLGKRLHLVRSEANGALAVQPA